MIIDVHCHYTLTRREAIQPDRSAAMERFSFEPARDADGSPALDSFLAPRVFKRLIWCLTPLLAGMGWNPRPSPDFDRKLEDWYERHLLGEGPVERTVLLAFDRYHDDAGRRPPPPDRRGQPGSDMYTSNSLIRDLCRRHPDRFLFGASVHPYREDAVACVDEVFAAGACLIKWLPLHQNINCEDPRTIAVLRRCAKLGLPLLMHYGEEFTLATQHPQFVSVEPLLAVLRELRRAGQMPICIIAHVATPALPWGDRRPHQALVSALLDEFGDAPLYADIAALTAYSKLGWLRRLARMQELHPKLVFGSDFPVPMGTPLLRRQLGRDYRKIVAEVSWPARALAIYRHFGFNEIVFHRAAMLLPNICRFAVGPAGRNTDQSVNASV
jgi:hypothetical protein